MQKRGLRSDCPINYPLEIVGDKWSLLIIRDIAIFGKTSYGEFLGSDEKIATNILSSRLAMLEVNNIINKKQDQANKTRFIYSLAQPGLDLIPLLIDMLIWSAKQHPIETGPDVLLAKMALENRQHLIDMIHAHLQAGNNKPFVQTLL
ncbi:MAG TPA: helix-turn-helix domain-containing protein [Candidatus Saccharimonadales bacterium]|nr:helix-turn-helix domain-containing protein [Candidatus Saccharimonadales bacterium]